MSKVEKPITSTPVVAAEEKLSKHEVALNVLDENLGLVQKAVQGKDEALIRRVLRRNAGVRKNIQLNDLETVIKTVLGKECPALSVMEDVIAALKSEKEMMMDVESSSSSSTISNSNPSASKRKKISTGEKLSGSGIREIELYLHLIVTAMLLTDIQVFHKHELLALKCVDTMILRATAQKDIASSSSNHRTLNILLAKAYHFWARVYELTGKYDQARVVLLAAHRTACLRLNEIGQATLINLILRNYLQCDLFDQAAKFIPRASFPANTSHNQQVRYLYYHGRTLATQLEYTEAFSLLIQAIRKVARTPSTHGICLTLFKLATVVQLLMGETPERSWFVEPNFQKELLPYYELILAVRSGKLSKFQQVCNTHTAAFDEDRNLRLVMRLRSSVIKTGLRSINKSYSRISLADIALKLGLDSAESAESICSKAIRDGVVDAVLDDENACLCTNDVADIYASTEPQTTFHRRIAFLTTVHDDAVKSMRFGQKSAPTNEDDEDTNQLPEDIVETLEKAMEEDD